MNREKVFGFIKIINIIAITTFGMLFVLGAAYSIEALFYSHLFQIAILGYLLTLIFGILSYRKNIFLLGCLAGWLIFGWANIIDSKKASDENSQLCVELRAEPSCSEDECSFDCSNFHGIGFVTGGSVCKDKDMSLCRKKVANDKKIESEVQDVLKVYSEIVDRIVASPSPASENFENQMVAIYNCLERKYGPGAEGEQRAIQVLKQKNLTTEQLNKYYQYLSRNGDSVNTRQIVAGLPNGDKKLSCEYINAK